MLMNMLQYFMLADLELVLIYLKTKQILKQQKNFGNKEKLFQLFVMDLRLQVNEIILFKKYLSFNSFLVNVTDQNGKSVFFGRKATAFSNAEETAEKIIDFIPFPLETRLRQLGAKYEKSSQMFGSHVVVDGQRQFYSLVFLFSVSLFFLVITGQNPASGHDFGVAILNALNKK